MIEYKAPSGSGLQYSILQQSLTLDNIDLKSLTTSPYQLISIPSYIGIINCTLQYINNICNIGSNLYVGYESLLGSQQASAFCYYDTTYMSGNRGVISLGNKSVSYWHENTLNNEPLVLWQQIDDSSANYSLFKLIITYIAFNI